MKFRLPDPTPEEVAAAAQPVIEEAKRVLQRRATSLGPHEVFLLRAWAEIAWHAFGEMPYLVGSVARGEAWRDVDVRCITPEGMNLTSMGLAALNAALSLWAARATGLPVDFQFQPEPEWRKHDGEERQALGVLGVVYPDPDEDDSDEAKR